MYKQSHIDKVQSNHPFIGRLTEKGTENMPPPFTQVTNKIKQPNTHETTPIVIRYTKHKVKTKKSQYVIPKQQYTI